MAEKVTIDGKEYTLDNLSEKAKQDLASLNLADRKINENKQELAILQTARNAYARSLSEQLPVEKQ
jgi:cytochrome c biogenesis factor